jgi:hypothetical protein
MAGSIMHYKRACVQHVASSTLSPFVTSTVIRWCQSLLPLGFPSASPQLPQIIKTKPGDAAAPPATAAPLPAAAAGRAAAFSLPSAAAVAGLAVLCDCANESKMILTRCSLRDAAKVMGSWGFGMVERK